MKKEFLLIKRVDGVVAELKHYGNADDLLKDAMALDLAAPSGTSYQTVYGYNVSKDYAVGDAGDEFDLLDEMES